MGLELGPHSLLRSSELYKPHNDDAAGKPKPLTTQQFKEEAGKQGVIPVYDPLHGKPGVVLSHPGGDLTIMAPDGQGNWGEYPIDPKFAAENYNRLIREHPDLAEHYPIEED